MVTVNIEYPFSKVVGKLDQASKHFQKNTTESKHAKRDKRKSDKSAKSDPPAEDQ